MNYEWKLIDSQFIFDVGVRSRENAKEMFLLIYLWKEDETTDTENKTVRDIGRQWTLNKRVYGS